MRCPFHRKRSTRWSLCSAKNRFCHEDRIAMRLAARFGLTYEYKLARRHRLTPIEALEDWDMLYPEDYKLFEE